ncbi:hypothetical protein [Nitrospira sp. KM1]|uniref:hypothetical protein n=1 Tax=Nitrospira sp. KM1 TaxID=1936990 RepID=UPI0015633F36|nr:hypothetical protein [Nitrospira sp. KM1]
MGGISNRTAVYCNEQGKYILLQNDEHGFANPGGSWKNQNPDLAVVGDSFAHGACVPSEQSVSALLRETYPTTLNLGNDGNGPLAELATLKEYLSVLKPKVLLWVYCETNDLTDLIQERRSLLINYLDPLYTQGLVLKQREIDDALMSYTELMAFGGTATIRLAGLLRGLFQVDNYNGRVEELIKLSYVWKLLAGIFKPTPESSVEQVTPSVSPQDLDLFKQIVKSAKDTVYDWGGKMIFVYLPQFERYAETGQANPHYQTVLSIVSELKIPIVDIVPVFWRQPDPLDLFPFRQPAHYTPEGYDIVAQEIRRFLQMEMPLQSSPPL